MRARVKSGSSFESSASYSRAARAGQLVVVSGTAHLGDDGRAVPEGDVSAQTRGAFEMALEAAAELGASVSDVIRTRVYLLSGVDWQAATLVHGEIFRGVDPANTTLFVAGLIPRHALVEVELDAVISAGDA